MLKQLKVMGSFQWAGQTEANWAWNTGQGYVVFCGVQATIFIVISAFWLAYTDHHDNLSCTACNITSIKVQKFWLLKTYSYTRFIVSMVHNNITSPTHAHPLVPFLQKLLISVLRFPYWSLPADRCSDESNRKDSHQGMTWKGIIKCLYSPAAVFVVLFPSLDTSGCEKNS